MMTTAGAGNGEVRTPKSYELAAISPGLNEVMAAEGGGAVLAPGGVRADKGGAERTNSMSGTDGITLMANVDMQLSIKEPIMQGFSTNLVKKNVELKASVMELEDLLETTNEVQLEGVNTNKETLSSRNENSVRTILEYDEEYRCPTSSHINRDKLVDLLGLQMDTNVLNSQLSIMKKITKAQRFIRQQDGGVLSISQFRSTAPSPSGSVNIGAGGGANFLNDRASPSSPVPSDRDGLAHSVFSARTNMTNVSALPTEVLGTETRIEELLAMLNQPKVPEMKQIIDELSHLLRAVFPPEGNVLATCMQNLHITAHTDVQSFVHDQLKASNQAMKNAISSMHHQEKIYMEWRQKIEAAEAKQRERQENENANDDDDIAPEHIEEYEQSILEYIHSIEKALHHSKGRVGNVSMQKAKDKHSEEDNFRSKFENSQETCRAQIGSWRGKVKDLQSRIGHDQDKCQVEQERRDTEHEKALELFHQTKEGSVEKLRNFSAEQEKLWEEVAVRVAQMGDITKERAKEVQVHIARAEEEHRRRRFYEEYCALNKRHGEHMEMVKTLAEQSDKILDQLSEFEEHMSIIVEAKNFDEGLEELREKEYTGFVELYTPFVTTTGVAIGKKDARKLVSEMTVGMAEQQLAGGVKSAVDKKRFHDMRRTHVQVLEQIKSASSAMYDRLDYWEAQFLKVKDLMTGGTIEDPAIAAEAQWAATVEKAQAEVKAAMAKETDTQQADEKQVEEERVRAEDAISKLRAKREASPPRRSGARKTGRPASGRPTSGSPGRNQSRGGSASPKRAAPVAVE